MRNAIFVAAILGALAVSGCGGNKAAGANKDAVAGNSASGAKTGPNGTKLLIQPAAGISGTVSRVNVNSRFAVLTFPVGQMPAINQRLYVYRQGLMVGELKVSGPRQDDSIVADIVAGGADVNDEVRDR